MTNTTLSLINSYTAPSGGVANFTFANIPQTYTNLLLKLSVRSTRTGVTYDEFVINLNSGGTYSNILLRNNGSGFANYDDGNSIGFTATAAGTANSFTNTEIWIPNYASSAQKSYFLDSTEEENAGGAFMTYGATIWSLSNPVTSITIGNGTGNVAQYSTAYLYGIKNS